MSFDPRKDYYKRPQREPLWTADLGKGMSVTFFGSKCTLCRHNVKRHDKDGCWGAKLKGGRCDCRLVFTQVEEIKVELPHPNDTRK